MGDSTAMQVFILILLLIAAATLMQRDEAKSKLFEMCANGISTACDE
jgi:hypothetical protein